MFFEIKENIKEFFDSNKLPVVLDSVGFFDVQPHMTRPEGFHCHHLLWVTKGEGIFTFNGKSVTLTAGQGIYFSKGFPHEYKAGKDGVFGSAWITFHGLDNLMLCFGITNCFIFKATDEVSAAAHLLHKHCLQNSTVITRSAKFYSLMTELLTSHFAPTVPLTERIDRYLENNFSMDVSLDDIAETVSLNKFTLCKRYLEASGTTVMNKLKSIRIAKAKQYLLNTAFSVEKIGEMCGFQSPSYFGKVFREVTGKTPREYRIRIK
ncbi:MAG: helix-turn-helix domain-containing protein [Clostridia bacterium]|nr:helix-turn-helix domain-containing protein [Clostridia bacterium]